MRPDDIDPDEDDDPNDPSHPDHDLSEAGGWRGYEPAPKPWFTRRWVSLLIAAVVIVALVVQLAPR